MSPDPLEVGVEASWRYRIFAVRPVALVEGETSVRDISACGGVGQALQQPYSLRTHREYIRIRAKDEREKALQEQGSGVTHG